MDQASIIDTQNPIKVVLLGASTVGKTSIVNTAVSNEFVEDQQPTIGACFITKKTEVNGKMLRLHLWDTAGQERFRSLAPMYFRDANFALIVYAINDENSFNAVQGWYDSLVNECMDVPTLYLIGNKIDLTDNRIISAQDGQDLATKLQAKFYEISAKTGDNVEKLFNDLAKECYEQMMLNTQIDSKERPVEKPEKSKKGCC